MSWIYEWLGRLVVQTINMRYGREIRIVAGVGAALAALAVGAYLATRGDDVESQS